jgi:hypothetical protein
VGLSDDSGVDSPVLIETDQIVPAALAPALEVEGEGQIIAEDANGIADFEAANGRGKIDDGLGAEHAAGVDELFAAHRTMYS